MCVGRRFLMSRSEESGRGTTAVKIAQPFGGEEVAYNM
jgi:hypothetical protein